MIDMGDFSGLDCDKCGRACMGSDFDGKFLCDSCYREAVESLRKRVKELEAELKERQEAFDRASCCVVEERLVNERLERKLKIAEEALTAIDNNCACGGYMEVIYGGKGRRCNKCGKESK